MEKTEPIAGTTGLKNVGNSCYMNAVLQSLFHCAPLVKYILSGEADDELKGILAKVKRKEQVYTPFKEFRCDYWTGKHRVMDPSQFKMRQGLVDERWRGRF
jgi:ubiquitin C-terminal hydrolase